MKKHAFRICRVAMRLLALGLAAWLLLAALSAIFTAKQAAKAGTIPVTYVAPQPPPTPADAGPRVRAQLGYAPRAKLVRLPRK